MKINDELFEKILGVIVIYVLTLLSVVLTGVIFVAAKKLLEGY